MGCTNGARPRRGAHRSCPATSSAPRRTSWPGLSGPPLSRVFVFYNFSRPTACFRPSVLITFRLPKNGKHPQEIEALVKGKAYTHLFSNYKEKSPRLPKADAHGDQGFPAPTENPGPTRSPGIIRASNGDPARQAAIASMPSGESLPFFCKIGGAI
jgi:hypothetical protein